MLSTLFALAALAAAPDALEPEPPEVAEVAPVSPAELLAEARKRMLRGDYDGVRLLTTELAQRPDADLRAARYLTAMSWELGGDPARALPLYDALLAEQPHDADVAFRRAETLGRLGRHGEALAQLDQVEDLGDWTGGDRMQLDLLRAVFELEAGFKPRRPLVRLQEALERAQPHEAPYYQARGRHLLVRMAVRDAEALAFDGRERKKRRRMEQRAALVRIATDQTVALIALEVPELVLDGLLALGQAHEAFGDAMLQESWRGRLRRLDPDQRAHYEAERAQRVEALWVKAARFYDRGLRHAADIGFEGPVTGALARAHQAVTLRIEAGPR